MRVRVYVYAICIRRERWKNLIPSLARQTPLADWMVPGAKMVAVRQDAFSSKMNPGTC